MQPWCLCSCLFVVIYIFQSSVCVHLCEFFSFWSSLWGNFCFFKVVLVVILHLLVIVFHFSLRVISLSFGLFFYLFAHLFKFTSHHMSLWSFFYWLVIFGVIGLFPLSVVFFSIFASLVVVFSSLLGYFKVLCGHLIKSPTRNGNSCLLVWPIQ